MKASEIKVGGFYTSKVSEKIVVVRVDDITKREGTAHARAKTVYTVTNMATKRVLVFDSAARFRGVACDPSGESKKAGTPKGGQHSGPSAHDPKAEAEARAVLDKMDQLANAPKSGLMDAVRAVGSADDSPHLIVEARAGTGKTTTLVGGIKRILGVPTHLEPSEQQLTVWKEMERSAGKVKSICFVAFNKSIAEELKTRVPSGCEAMTMHGMGFRAVRERFGAKVQVKEHRVGEIVAALLGVDPWEASRTKGQLVRSVKHLVGLCKMNLTDPTPEELDRLTSYYEVELDDEKGSWREETFEMVPKVIERCKDVAADNTIDYDDMVWLPVALDLSVRRYDVLLVDEAQDLNRCQQALAKKAGRRLILCGDPKQAIYGFAGADAESMNRMITELSGMIAVGTRVETPDGPGETMEMPGRTIYCRTAAGDKSYPINDVRPVHGRGIKVLPLTVTRRCGKAIVSEANKIVPDFEAFDANGPGSVSRAAMKGDTNVSPAGANWPYRQLARDGDMVLCRVNAPLVSECFKFLREGRKANIQGRDVGQGLISTVRKVAKKISPDGPELVGVPELIRGLQEWCDAETAKENAKKFPSEAKLIAVQDRFDCIVCFTEGLKRVHEVVAKIESVFTDDKTSPGVKLSSIHKAKGLEAKRVFLLEPEGATVPHPMAKTAWQREQEMNLRYVAITRAIEELVYVS